MRRVEQQWLTSFSLFSKIEREKMRSGPGLSDADYFRLHSNLLTLEECGHVFFKIPLKILEPHLRLEIQGSFRLIKGLKCFEEANRIQDIPDLSLKVSEVCLK